MVAGMISPPAEEIRVAVLSHTEEVHVELRDRREDAVALFAALGDEQRTQLARDAWTIGLRALHNAHRTAQEARLADIGGTLIADIDLRLRAHADEQQRGLTQALTAYFDPRDGQISERLAAFVDDQGALARLPQRCVGPSESVLSEALARQVDESSPLFKKLSPTESEGVVELIAGELRVAVSRSHPELSRALDPLAEDGAVARFLRRLRGALKGSNENTAKQLSVAALRAGRQRRRLAAKPAREGNAERPGGGRPRRGER